MNFVYVLRFTIFLAQYLIYKFISHSEEANWSGSAMFVIQYVNLYQQPGSSDLIGWKLEVEVAF